MTKTLNEVNDDYLKKFKINIPSLILHYSIHEDMSKFTESNNEHSF